MEQNFVSLENFTDFVYYDTEFDKSPPARDWCAHLVPWWGAGVGQASLLLILLILYRLFRLCPSLNCPHAANILTLYVNLSLWVWVVFLILAFTTCSIGLNNALVITAIVFVAVFGLGSVLDCFFGTEGWYLVDLKHMTDAIHQLEKMKTSPPVHRVHIECFHTETFTLFNTRGKFFTRSRKVVTYTDHRDFPFSSWSDVSDWPVLETIANQGILIIGMSIERLVEPGDPDTNQAFINFRNRFVQQNCHRDEQVRTWVTSEIPDIGTDPSLFISTKPKEQMPFIFKIGVFLILSSFCLSCPLKTLIRKKTKLIPLKVRKVYFADPDKLSPYLGLMNNGPGHTTNSGFGAKGSMLHNGSHSMQKDISGLDKSNLRGGQMDGYNLQYSTNQQGLNGKDPMYHGKDTMYQGKDPSYLGKDPLYPGKDPLYPGKDSLYPGKDPLYPGKDPLYPGKDPLYPGKDPLYPGKDLSGVYLPGKDYYDESLYSGRKAGPPISLHNNFGDGYYEEEERHYASSTHPRVAMLKNTNIETDMRGREIRENRRVHYQERDFRRQQSPSPGPRQRAAYPGQHRSRRADGDESWTLGSGYGYQQSFPEDEVQYNA